MLRFQPSLLLCAVALSSAGCSWNDADNRAAPVADVNAAAAAALGDIANYADRTTPVATPAAVAAAVPLADPDAVSAAEDAARAAAVARRYFAAIAARDYNAAYALWDNGANPLERRGFTDDLARYAAYEATVGPPGRIDAGAGQRYVTIPVRVAATLRGGPATATEGALVLHRTAAIDGATAAQRSWRIRGLHLDGGDGDPVAATAAAPPPVVRATYRCEGATRLSVRFDNRADTASIRVDDSPPSLLRGQRPASGIWYRGQGYELRGKGDSADFTAPGRPAIACTADE